MSKKIIKKVNGKRTQGKYVVGQVYLPPEWIGKTILIKEINDRSKTDVHMS